MIVDCQKQADIAGFFTYHNPVPHYQVPVAILYFNSCQRGADEVSILDLQCRTHFKLDGDLWKRQMTSHYSITNGFVEFDGNIEWDR